jgi:acetoin utilization protein AcuB
MIVGMWMTQNPITIAPQASISDAAVEMSRRHVRRLLVADATSEGPRLLGIVTSYDVARAFPPDVNPFSAVAGDARVTRPVSTVMARAVRTATPDTPIEVAASILRIHKIGALPVVRGPCLVGLITESDIFQAFIEVTGAKAHGVRITLDVGDDETAVARVIEMGVRYSMHLASVLSLRHRNGQTGDEQRLAVVWLAGETPADLVAGIWTSGYRVLSVLQLDG